jgi:DNA primase
MKTNWIDFKELRSKLDFEAVLRHYKVEVKRKGDQHHGFCPLPGHEGKKNSPSFSANLARGIFNCFGCGAKGNILEFAALMQKVDPKDGKALRTVALTLHERFCPDTRDGLPLRETAPTLKETAPESELSVEINAPLDFELKGLDPDHPYLLDRGFSEETILHFGLGFCSRGSLKGRVAIPLHDTQGRLIGYAGRLVNENAVSEENPRYRFPSKRERDGTIFEFKKGLFLYNGFRVKQPVDDLIVVEGFTATWWLHQNGFKNVVATMGIDPSDKQAEIVTSLVNSSGRVWLMPDGGDAGDRLARAFLPKISPHRFVRWVKLESDTQPTDMSAKELKLCFFI